MEYIIVLNPGMIEPQILTDTDGFIATFASIDNAKETAEIIVNEPGIITSYAIYAQVKIKNPTKYE